MGTILVTGFTGTVGREVADALISMGESPVCAVRNPGKAEADFAGSYEFVKLDYNDPQTYGSALKGIDRVFLMFPPEISFAAFHAFIGKMKEEAVKHITYLSLKDVQYVPFLPHFKNEKEIKRTGIPYTFLRAGYFMQNLNLFLLDELREEDRIFVAAGRGKTSFIDVRDIAEVAALSLIEPEKHRNASYPLTGSESLDFFKVADMMTEVLGRKITYTNPTVKDFKIRMLSKGLDSGYVQVVTGIHFATKLGLAKGVTKVFQELTGKQPRSMKQYLEDYKPIWKQAGR
ncbi:SDR family oxidoreductase [Paenibacillus gansuensis]|uniref:SDR family oxidoreductase n=1 Tax=Paenibacillus gansuensis TaxID=306542 RepID=A0ABW5PF32_9BACL